jgi:hypothetical protein
MAFFVTAVEAVAAAWATTTVATVATAVSSVGMAMSVTGLVTGNQNLIKYGGQLSLVGGVTSLAAGAFEKIALEKLGTEAIKTGADAGTNVLANQSAIANTAGDLTASNLQNFGSYAGDIPNNINAQSFSNNALNAASPPPVEIGVNSAPNLSSVETASPAQAAAAPAAPAAAAPPMSAADKAAVMTDSTGTQSSTISDAAANGTLTGGNSFAPGSIQDYLNRTQKWFKELSPLGQAEILKSILAVPGGIQAQKNKADELAMLQQKTNQSSYGNSIRPAGIINLARGY